MTAANCALTPGNVFPDSRSFGDKGYLSNEMNSFKVQLITRSHHAAAAGQAVTAQAGDCPLTSSSQIAPPQPCQLCGQCIVSRIIAAQSHSCLIRTHVNFTPAVLVWTHLNGRPWEEGVYHRILDKLVSCRSEEVAYVAALTWPAGGLIDKVKYRPAMYRVYKGGLDEEGEREVLTAMLREEHDYGVTGLYTEHLLKLRWNLNKNYMPNFMQDTEITYLESGGLPGWYIRRHGFTHRICGLVSPYEVYFNYEIKEEIKDKLLAPCWSKEVCEAAMLLYISLNIFIAGGHFNEQQFKDILEIIEERKNKFFTPEQNQLISFYLGKQRQVKYQMLKKFINHILFIDKNLYEKEIRYKHKVISEITDRIERYINNGIIIKDLFFYGRFISNFILELANKKPDCIYKFMGDNQDDLTIKDILANINIIKREEPFINNLNYNFNDKCSSEEYFKTVFSVLRRIKYLGIDRDDYMSYIKELVCKTAKEIIEIESKDNFNKDLIRMFYSCFLDRSKIFGIDQFNEINHIGLAIYYGICNDWKNDADDLFNLKFNNELCKIYNRISKRMRAIFHSHGYNSNKNTIGKLEYMMNIIEYKNFSREDELDIIKSYLAELLLDLFNINKDNKNLIYNIRTLMIDKCKHIQDNYLKENILNILNIERRSTGYII
jgi:hypothetical protein